MYWHLFGARCAAPSTRCAVRRSVVSDDRRTRLVVARHNSAKSCGGTIRTITPAPGQWTSPFVLCNCAAGYAGIRAQKRG